MMVAAGGRSASKTHACVCGIPDALDRLIAARTSRNANSRTRTLVNQADASRDSAIHAAASPR